LECFFAVPFDTYWLLFYRLSSLLILLSCLALSHPGSNPLQRPVPFWAWDTSCGLALPIQRQSSMPFPSKGVNNTLDPLDYYYRLSTPSNGSCLNTVRALHFLGTLSSAFCASFPSFRPFFVAVHCTWRNRELCEDPIYSIQ
jgi:hypothetical protein